MKTLQKRLETIMLVSDTKLILLLVKEWLEAHRKNYGRTKPVYHLVRQQTIDWLLADLTSLDNKEITGEQK